MSWKTRALPVDVGSSGGSWKDRAQSVDVADEPKTSLGESALRGAEQGATFGFADELAGLGGALGAELGSLGVDKVESTHPEVQKAIEDLGRNAPNSSDVYRQTRDEERAKFRQASEDNPMAYLGGELGGGLINPASRLGGSLSGAVGLGAAAGLGGSDSDLSSDKNLKENVSSALKDTALGAGFGAGGYGVGKAIPKMWEGVKYFGKKGLTNLGPSEEAINARLAKQAQPTAKSYTGLAEDFSGTTRKLEAEARKLSNEAGVVLSKDKAIPKEAIINPLDMELEKLLIDGKAVGKTDKSVVSALQELKEDFVGLGDNLSEADIKRVIKKMDDNINWDDQSQKRLNTILKQVRHSMDDMLKSRNPAYRDAMAPVAERTGLADDLKRLFNLKSVPGEGLQPTDTTATKIQTSLRENKGVTQDKLKQLANLTGEDYRALAKDYSLAQQFEKTGAQGSRRTNVGAGLGGLVGTVLSPGLGTAMGAGLGAAAGATMDRYGGQVAGKLIDSYLKAGNSAAFGKFKPIIEAAERRGPQALATVAAMLSQDPEFREQMQIGTQ